MLDVIKTRNIWFVISGIIIIAGIVSLSVFGLNLGIDFKGGSIAEIKFIENQPQPAEIESTLEQQGIDVASIQRTDQETYNVRTVELNPERHEEMKQILIDKFGAIEELSFESIGPTISREITRKAFYQLLLVSFGILAYVAFAFRRVPKPLSSWKFGLSAIAALVHDLMVVIGAFALLGHFLNVEIDALFVTALLTVLGFSVHDTIIMFDRIRENLKRLSGASFSEVVSRSVNQTLVRSINTSTTVVFVLLALLLFGGESIRWFVVALLIGVTAGAYSSIFFATPLLHVWHKDKVA